MILTESEMRMRRRKRMMKRMTMIVKMEEVKMRLTHSRLMRLVVVEMGLVGKEKDLERVT